MFSRQDPGIAGVLTDQFGDPVVGATVSFYDSDGSLVSIAFTDNDGYFSFSSNLSFRSTFVVQISLASGASITQKVTVKHGSRGHSERSSHDLSGV
jgi:hypothetical protein